MKRQQGFTLLEALIALFVFGIVAAIATAGVVNVLRVQALNEAVTSSQAKLRRVTEVFTQELRSAVLGGVTNSPYSSGPNQISFLLLDGGAGYQVLPHDSGSNDSFKAATNVQISTSGPLATVVADLDDSQVLMVNANGDAVVLDVTNVTQNGGSGSNTYRLAHPACANTIDYTTNTLIMSVRSLGLSYDPVTGNLNQRTGATGAAVPLAFDLDGLDLEYVYQESDGTPHVLTSPLLEGGVPVKEGLISSAPVTLMRVQLTVSASEVTTGNRPVSRSYTGQVEMSANPSFSIDKVVACGT